MNLQQDFINEITLLQFHARQIGVDIDRTPKCHPEMAGEGIEYAWALAKLKYRRSPIAAKRTKQKFRNLVQECTDPLESLSKSRIRSCSKKARSYMKLYKVVQSLHEREGVSVDKKHSVLESTTKLYMKMKRVSKSHRSISDRSNRRDLDDIENVDNEVDSNIDLIEQCDHKIVVKNKMI